MITTVNCLDGQTEQTELEVEDNAIQDEADNADVAAAKGTGRLFECSEGRSSSVLIA